MGRLGSLGRGFTIMGAIILAVNAVACGVGVWAAVVLSGKLVQSDVVSRALHNHMDGDMMHDALRADVYRAFWAASNDPAARAEVEAGVEEHFARFVSDIEANRKLALPPHVQEALGTVDAPLQAYGAAARKIVTAAFADPVAAIADLPEFNAAFTELEGQGERVGDLLASEVEAVRARGQRIAAIAWPLTAAAGLLSIAAVLFLVRNALTRILRPLNRMTEALGALAHGDLEIQVPEAGRVDEIGEMAAAMGRFKENAREAGRLRAEQDALRDAAAAERMAALEAMANDVEEVVGRSVRQISDRMEKLTTERSGGGAAERALASAEAASEATSQLEASIREIAARTQGTSGAVRDAVESGRRTEETIRSLAETVTSIRSFADAIAEISERTGLLALNASIEAARAGDAGRGFAVVAQEVKELANQAAKSTEAIRRQVGEIGAATEAAVQSVTAMGAEIGRIDGMAAAIAAAVEQQTAVCREIGQGAGSTRQSASEVREVASAVSQHIDELRVELVRAARTQHIDVDRRTAKRYALKGTARLEVGGRHQDLDIIDVSVGGAALRGDHELSVGAGGTLALPGLTGPIAFEVVAASRGQLSVTFRRRLDDGQLADLSRGASIRAA